MAFRGSAAQANTATASTCVISTSSSISAISIAASAVVTLSTVSGTAPFGIGTSLTFSGVVGMTQINGLTGVITATGGSSGAWTCTVNINSSGFSAYSSGGTAAISIQAGDTVLLEAICGNGTALTLSCPGFSAPLNFITTGFAGATYQVLMKVAGASEPSSYTVTSSASDFMSGQCRVYSGRSGVVTDAAMGTPVVTGASPIAFSQGGVNAAANDDVVFMGIGEMGNSMTTNSYTPTAGFSNAFVGYFVTNFLGATFCSDKLNVSAGATGAFTDSVTFTGAANISVDSYVLSLAAGSPPPTNTAPIAWTV